MVVCVFLANSTPNSYPDGTISPPPDAVGIPLPQFQLLGQVSLGGWGWMCCRSCTRLLSGVSLRSQGTSFSSSCFDQPGSWSGSSSLLTLPPHAFVFFSFGKAHTLGSSSAGAANLLTLWVSENVFIPASSQSQLLDSVENSMLNNFLEFRRHFSIVFWFSVCSRGS